jgi:phosphatidylglycerophosphatase C
MSSTAPSSDRPVVAAFDVDGTLTSRDCVRPFLVRVGGYRGVLVALTRRPWRTLMAAVRRDRDRVKEIVVGGVLRKRRISEVDQIGARFADSVRSAWLRDDTIARLRWHQQRGHRTVLVSASLGAYLRPLGRLLGVDDVLCTDPAVEPSGEFIADGLLGRNCRADEKVRRLDEWLERHHLRNAELWAYGDSNGDTALLARADHPVWVKDVTVTAEPRTAA